MQQTKSNVSIRAATQSDRDALERLALLDATRPVGGDTLVAEVDGEIHAALPLAYGHVIADPFEPTEHLADLLQLRARQLEASADSQPGRVGRLLVHAVPAFGRHV